MPLLKLVASIKFFDFFLINLIEVKDYKKSDSFIIKLFFLLKTRTQIELLNK